MGRLAGGSTVGRGRQRWRLWRSALGGWGTAEGRVGMAWMGRAQLPLHAAHHLLLQGSLLLQVRHQGAMRTCTCVCVRVHPKESMPVPTHAYHALLTVQYPKNGSRR
eukprot:49229-Pelagomonas_calceolata.AAC.2